MLFRQLGQFGFGLLLFRAQIAQRAGGLGNRGFGIGQGVAGVVFLGLGLADVALEVVQFLPQVGALRFCRLFLLAALGDLDGGAGVRGQGCRQRRRQQQRQRPRRRGTADGATELAAAEELVQRDIYFAFPWLATAFIAAAIAAWSPR